MFVDLFGNVKLSYRPCVVLERWWWCYRKQSWGARGRRRTDWDQTAVALPGPAHSSVSTVPKPLWQIRIESMHHIISMIHRSPKSKRSVPWRTSDFLIIECACVCVCVCVCCLRKWDRQRMNGLVCIWQCFYKSFPCVFYVSERVNRFITGLQNVSQSTALYVSHVFVSVFGLYLREGDIYACGLAKMCFFLRSHNVQSRA